MKKWFTVMALMLSVAVGAFGQQKQCDQQLIVARVIQSRSTFNAQCQARRQSGIVILSAGSQLYGGDQINCDQGGGGWQDDPFVVIQALQSGETIFIDWHTNSGFTVPCNYGFKE